VLVDPDGDWPDHVFDEGYELMPLTDLARYVQEHRHLPDVPTQAAAAAQGVAVGQMQAVLLQKIEELTLHVIALQQENERLKARLSVLEQHL
jgi:hypothetical protein